MKYRESIILLPCHSLEDFPLHYEGDEAQGLLAGWSALWHPALVAATGAIPNWCRADDPPEEVQQRLIIVPQVALSELPAGFLERAEAGGARLITSQTDRALILAHAMEGLDGGDGRVDPSLAADLLALGYCYLQIELLTRQMRYASNLDEVHFAKQAVGAAEAAMAGQHELAGEKLSACFDLLAEERDHYYPVDAYLIDLALVARTTGPAALRRELASSTPVNLLMDGDALEQLQPECLERLVEAIGQERVTLVGGEREQLPLPLLAGESVLAQLQRGLAEYQRLLQLRPTVFGRRRYGLTPTLPQILHKLGFQAALHATLDDGRFPEGSQIKTRWESSEGTSIDAIARAPLDATRPETFLKLAVKLGESMDTDHVATVCLAHWAGQSNPWLDDLRRIGRYGAALGKLISLDCYFRETDDSGQLDRFTADQYRSPYLKQSVSQQQKDPISRYVRYWQRLRQTQAAAALQCLATLVTGQAADLPTLPTTAIDQALEHPEMAAQLDEQLDQQLQQAMERFAAALGGQSQQPEEGYLVANPSSFTRRLLVPLPRLNRLPDLERPVYAAGQSGGQQHAVVDVPPMGFVWITSGSGKVARKRRDDPLLVDEAGKDEGYITLRNEFFQVLIDRTTGAMRSLYQYGTRGNRLSHQLAYRTAESSSPPGGAAPQYSVMAADTMEVLSSDKALGQLRVSGRLLDRRGKTLGRYCQTYRLWRGSRVLEVEVELEPVAEPQGDPWKSYYAARFAWPDEAADLWCTVHGQRQPVGGKRFEAPEYIDILDAGRKQRTTILTGGLPFHCRQGHRMLDTLLIVPGETARSFRFGIGVDVSQPWQQAESFTAPEAVLFQRAAAPHPARSAWLFSVDSRHVAATHWEPLVVEGSVAGFRVRLLETAGRAGRTTLRSFRPIGQAQQLDFLGHPLGDCPVEHGTVRIELGAGEWVQLQCRWQQEP